MFSVSLVNRDFLYLPEILNYMIDLMSLLSKNLILAKEESSIFDCIANLHQSMLLGSLIIQI